MRLSYQRGPSPAPPRGTPVTWGGVGGRRVGTVTGSGPDGSVTVEIDDPEALRALRVPDALQAGEWIYPWVPQFSTTPDSASVVPPPCGKRGWADGAGCVLPGLHEGPCRFTEPEPEPPPRCQCGHSKDSHQRGCFQCRCPRFRLPKARR